MKRILCATAFLWALACSDSVDRAAKRRIFSPEDPPQAVAAASEKIAVERVGTDPLVARRVLEMGAAEAVERLGPHQFEATASFEWSGGERTVQLSETRTLSSARGGVSGDYHGTLVNSRDQGFEVWRVKGQVYASNRYGKPRQRLRDRGMAERSRDELRGALRQLDGLVGHRLKLSYRGAEELDGRPVLKFEASLGSGNTDADPKALPPALLVKGSRPDEGTRLRQSFYQRARPTEVTGEVWVDKETAVVLKADVEAKALVAQDAGADW